MNNNAKKKRKKPTEPTYSTLGLAEKYHVDSKLKTTTPSIQNVEETREWSKENKL